MFYCLNGLFRTSFETDSIQVRPYFDERLENTGLFAISVEQVSNKLAQKPVKWAFLPLYSDIMLNKPIKKLY
jgi:hypothetical protein